VALILDTGPLLAALDAAPTAVDLARCRDLQAQYRDLALGVVDASVLALAERLDEPKLATLDQRHFRVVRPSHVASLELRP
jgi:predicted nucleic acid-binding protein